MKSLATFSVSLFITYFCIIIFLFSSQGTDALQNICQSASVVPGDSFCNGGTISRCSIYGGVATLASRIIQQNLTQLTLEKQLQKSMIACAQFNGHPTDKWIEPASVCPPIILECNVTLQDCPVFVDATPAPEDPVPCCSAVRNNVYDWCVGVDDLTKFINPTSTNFGYLSWLPGPLTNVNACVDDPSCPLDLPPPPFDSAVSTFTATTTIIVMCMVLMSTVLLMG